MVQPAKLTRDMIVREAVALLQEGGLEALTLRALAARLGVRAPSLARHVGDKGRLLAQVSAAIYCDALALIPPGLTGADWLLAYGHALRTKQSQTRDITALIASATADGQSDRLAQAALEQAMAGAGLAGPDAIARQAAIQALVTGWMVFETSPRAALFQARLPRTDSFAVALAALVRGFPEA